MEVVWFYDADGYPAIPVIQLQNDILVQDYRPVNHQRAYPYKIKENTATEEEKQHWNTFLENFYEIGNFPDADTFMEDYFSVISKNTTAMDHISLAGGSVELDNGTDTLTLSVTFRNSPVSPGGVYDSFKLDYNNGEIVTYFGAGASRKGSVVVYGQDSEGTPTSRFYSGGALIRDYTGNIGFIITGTLAKSTDMSQYFNPDFRSPDGTLYKYRFNMSINTSRYSGVSGIPAAIWKTFPNSKDSPVTEEDEGIVSVEKRYSPRIQTSGVGIYPLSEGQVSSFIMGLWTETFLEKINREVNGDPMNSILSLKWFYGIGSVIPRTEAETYVTIGNVAFNGNLTDEVITRPASREHITFTMSSVNVTRKHNNFLDLSPFTKSQIYIPYVGFRELPTTEIMGRSLRLDYNINIMTGAAIAYVYVSTGDSSWRVIQEHPCMMGVDIPLTINSSESLGNRIMTSITGVGSSLAGAGAGALGGPVGMMAGASMASGMLSNGLNAVSGLSGHTPSMTSGGLSSETGSLGDFTAYITLTRPQPKAPAGYNSMIGKPDYRNVNIGSMSGYIKIGAISKGAGAGNQNIPKEAMDEIDQLLKAGVYTR